MVELGRFLSNYLEWALHHQRLNVPDTPTFSVVGTCSDRLFRVWFHPTSWEDFAPPEEVVEFQGDGNILSNWQKFSTRMMEQAFFSTEIRPQLTKPEKSVEEVSTGPGWCQCRSFRSQQIRHHRWFSSLAIIASHEGPAHSPAKQSFIKSRGDQCIGGKHQSSRVGKFAANWWEATISAGNVGYVGSPMTDTKLLRAFLETVKRQCHAQPVAQRLDSCLGFVKRERNEIFLAKSNSQFQRKCWGPDDMINAADAKLPNVESECWEACHPGLARFFFASTDVASDAIDEDTHF